MELNLLSTKLHFPETRDVVIGRERLLKRLDPNTLRASRLVTIIAPAGFGKTTLIADCLRSSQDTIAWISLDSNDNEPIRFWSYVLSASLRAIGNLAEALLKSLHSSKAPSMISLLTEYINTIMTAGPVIILLDDYHVISNMDIHSDMEFFIDNMPSNVTIIITSRTDPPLRLARLRARGYLTEIRTDDLRFTTEEIGAFLTKAIEIDLEPSQISTLEKKTEGWITGLQLAALSLKGRKDIDQFLADFAGSHRYILSYLIDEVLSHQDDDIQSFLLETSILDQFCPELCDAVTGRSDSQAILNHLYQNNLFIMPLDDYGEWFRYHHLFAEVLRHRLTKTKHREFETLHQRASDWYAKYAVNENISHLISAVTHATKAHDEQRASALISSNRDKLSTYSELTTLLAWLNTLPKGLTDRQPEIGILHAWSLLTVGQYTECSQLLESIEHNLTHLKSSDRQMVDLTRGKIAAIRTTLSGINGELQSAVHFAEEADRLLPENEPIWRGLMLTHLGTAYLLNGDIQTASQKYAQSLPINQASDNKYEILVVMWRQARVNLLQGNLRVAQQAFEDVLKHADRWELMHFPPAQYARIDLAHVLLECNQPDRAAELLQTGIQNLQRTGGPTILLEALLFYAQVKLSKHEFDAAISVVDTAMELISRKKLPAWCESALSAQRIAYYLRTNKLSDAQQLIAGRDIVARPKHYFYVDEYLMTAKVYRHEGKYDQALDLLHWLYNDAEQNQRHHHRLKASLEYALVYQAMDDKTSAAAWFGNALKDGWNAGYVRTFLDEGLGVIMLLEQIQKSSSVYAYAQSLLATTRGTEESSVGLFSTGNDYPIESISEREMDVLVLLAEGLSDQEIADRLIISRRTVKKHNENIYGKLGVSNRTQAVARARELNMLP